MIINFVMSSYVKSSIFDNIIDYFKKYSNNKIIKSLHPVEKANVYYYFRIHKETNIKENSIVTVHHDLLEEDENLNIKLFIDKYKKCKLIVCLNTIQQEILKSYNINNTIVIPHGYNQNVLNNFKNNNKVDNEKIKIGFLSTFYPRGVKGEDYFIEFIKTLDKNKYSFLLVGGKRNLLNKEIEKLGFESYYYEHLPYNFFGEVYNYIDILFMFSEYEGGPANIPESLYTKTPIFSTNVGMVNDYKSNDLITLITKNKRKDEINFEKIFVNKKDNSYNLNIEDNLYNWEEIIQLYDKEFDKISNNEKIKNYYYFDFKFIHLKKTIKNKIKSINEIKKFKKMIKGK